MSRSECALACFKDKFSCSQAVFSAFAADLGMDRELALKVSCGFGGGMGHTGGTCGAVTGAVMAISLKHGRGTLEDTAAKEKTYTLVEDFCRDFKAKHGSLLCTDLIGHDLSMPEEAAIARERNAFEGVCPRLVKDAVEIVEKLL